MTADDIELPDGVSWVPSDELEDESAGVAAGTTEEGETIRVARCYQGDELGTANLIAGAGEALMGYFGAAIPCASFDVLVAAGPVRWVPADSGSVPDGAVPVGKDGSGRVIIVARVRVAGIVIPAKLIVKFHGAFAAWGVLEWFRRKYEVLCVCADEEAQDVTEAPETELTDTHEEDGLCDDRVDSVEVPEGLSWCYAVDGDTFDNAVSAGEDAEGRAQHVVRGCEEWELASGVLRVGEACASIPYYGYGSKHDRYEVLVNEGEILLKWVHAKRGNVPDAAVQCGVDRQGEVMYVARCKVQNIKIPGKLNVSMKHGYAAMDGKEYTRKEYEVLCLAEEGEELEEESVEEEECLDERIDQVEVPDGLEWISSYDGDIPPCAVIVDDGVSGDDGPLFVARASEVEELVPGGVHKGAAALFPYFGLAEGSESYDVLVNNGGVALFWVPACGGDVPEGAVQGGVSNDEQKIYVARAKVDECGGVYVAGKVREGYDSGYMAVQDHEVPVSEYEVLVAGDDGECLDGAIPAATAE